MSVTPGWGSITDAAQYVKLASDVVRAVIAPWMRSQPSAAEVMRDAS